MNDRQFWIALAKMVKGFFGVLALSDYNLAFTKSINLIFNFIHFPPSLFKLTIFSLNLFLFHLPVFSFFIILTFRRLLWFIIFSIFLKLLEPHWIIFFFYHIRLIRRYFFGEEFLCLKLLKLWWFLFSFLFVSFKVFTLSNDFLFKLIERNGYLFFHVFYWFLKE